MEDERLFTIITYLIRLRMRSTFEKEAKENTQMAITGIVIKVIIMQEQSENGFSKYVSIQGHLFPQVLLKQ